MRAPHLLHTNKYATLWDNPGVIMMINCQVIWLTINLFIWKVSPQPIIVKYISASIIIFWNDLCNAASCFSCTRLKNFIIISEAFLKCWHMVQYEMDAFVLFYTELSSYYWSWKSQLSFSRESLIKPIHYELHSPDGVIGFVLLLQICN